MSLSSSRSCLSSRAAEFFRLPRQRRALVKHAADLFSQRADAPTFHPAHLRVEVALQRLVQRDQRDEVGPRQLSYQRYDNLPVRENLGKLDHAAQVLVTKAPSKFLLQLSPQRGDNLLSVLRPFLPQHLTPDAVADLPVEQRESRVDRPCHAFTGLHNHFPHVGQQAAGTDSGDGQFLLRRKE